MGATSEAGIPYRFEAHVFIAIIWRVRNDQSLERIWPIKLI
jgi:hypothetical protein